MTTTLILSLLLLAAPTLAAAAENPLFEKSPLPYQLPQFEKIKDADFVPAFEEGMARQLKEVEAIADDAAAPTFDNTIVALERSGQLLTRAGKTFFNLNSSNTNDDRQKIEADMSPRLAAHSDAIYMNPKLFARVDALHGKRDALGLDPVQAQLLERYHLMFVRAGAKLSNADKGRLKEINQQISSLTTRFSQQLLKAAKDGAVVFDDVKQLEGLSPEQIGAAAAVAKARKIEGKWVVTLQNTTIQAVLENLKSRATREKVYRASVGRAQTGDTDNRPLVAKVVALRAEKAKLLGYPNYAAYVLADQGAKTPAAVNQMLAGIGASALRQAKVEAAEIQKVIDEQERAAGREPFKLAPWDWAFYAGQVRKAKYAFDQDQVKPYFEMDRVLKDGVFFAAHALYGISFKERPELKGYRPDVRVFEVFNEDGSTIGLILFDFFKRDNKNGGAWMDTYVDQVGLFDQKPVAVNNLNVPKPAEGQPVLLDFDEVTTMFHEFGHGLHGLFSDVKYPLIAGTATPQDFVEFPSQFNEMWAREPQILANFAKDYKTGEAMPKALFDKVIAAQKYGEGYATLEYTEAAVIDQAWHQITAAEAPKAEDVMAFERAALEKAGLAYDPVPPRYHTPYFLHPFNNGYEAAYYAYIWSEVLARDSGEWFHSHGGVSRANGDVFRARILSRGRTMEPDALFTRFYGGPPRIEPLLEYRGLSMPKPDSGGAGK